MSDVITRQYSIIRDGVRYAVELRIDVAQVAHEMVNNAARNASGKSTQMGSSIAAKVIDRAALSAAEQGGKA